VGLYQHDVKSKHLESTLAEVVESCVNYVGVDLNTASVDLLRYVAGLNHGTARRIIEYRQEHGPFSNRQQLLSVAGVGPATFVQCAGFLRISGGDQPLDATAIHPESYPIAELLLESSGAKVADIAAVLARETTLEEWVKKIDGVDAAKLLAQRLDDGPAIGEHLLQDLMDALKRPGRDPREQMPTPIFRKGILQVQDLSVGMALKGQVLNVVDFGVFVDIGIGESGLVHISNLAREYVRDPHQYFGVGDVIDVWVQSIDRKRGRVSLTAIDPQMPPLTPTTGRNQTSRDPKRVAASSASKGSGTDRPARVEAAHDRPAQRHRAHGDKAAGQRPIAKDMANQGSHRPRSAQPKYRDRQGPHGRKPQQPAKPLTDGMVQGTEPMRSFSDLFQFAKLAARTPQDQ
jgi:uncharacterized protein